jgi:hypothetical protein
MQIEIKDAYNATCFCMSKIKYAYPKKVCHMPTRHVKKKEKRKR